MGDVKVPPAPPGSGAAGRRLWRQVLRVYVLEEHERLLLEQACRTADVCEELQARVDGEGLLVESRLGEQRAHPALVELRQQRALLAKVLASLRIPLGDEDDEQRPQRRAGARGAYGIRGTVS